MKVAVMQPYLFPYLGYYQLVGAVEHFVFFDDVNFINKGWINRNNILNAGGPLLFTVPLKKSSQNKLINEIEIADFSVWRKDFKKKLEAIYKKSPFYNETMEWISTVLDTDHQYISLLAQQSITSLATLLQLPTIFSTSSTLAYNDEDTTDGQSKVLKICSLLGATDYINPANGVDLYNKESFSRQGMNLHFIQMKQVSYPQFKKDNFIPHLSIIDVMMFNGADGTKNLLEQYYLN